MGLREFEMMIDILLFAIDVQQIGGRAGDGHLQGLGDGLGGDAMERGFSLSMTMNLVWAGRPRCTNRRPRRPRFAGKWRDDLAGQGVAVVLGIGP
jgi:hypothetical protein